ncbi:DUF2993 domain-containing protein [Nostoc sp. MS1]|uniref:LmeA family phospholipid-binding protein n=1 Tax=Nostoc sp. MS1 TaxID=2764711 RepID=UPI001CC7DEEF|nr:DUF2993 domain-containing protein [Nostoc sp. MS1]BCL39194.1 hypothetical protein NSMS1_56410 [Nostoc sp. MS1]
MSDKQNLEGQLVSQVAERTISNQLEAAEQIDISVETDILKIVQGQADGVTIAGQGLVTKQNLRVQEIQLKTDTLAINPLSVIFGQVQLDKPLNFNARVKLTQADINSALASDFSRKFTQNFDLDVDGEIVNLKLQEIQIFLPGNSRIECQGKVLIHKKGETRPLGFLAKLRPRTSKQTLRLESFHCNEGEGVSLELIVALMQKFKALVNLPYYTWEGINIRIKDMEIQQGSLIIFSEAHVSQIPEAISELTES